MIKKVVLFTAIMVIFIIATNSCKKDSSSVPSVQEIRLNPQSLALKVGEEAELIATVTPSEANVQSWSSSNPSVAAVSKGKVIAGALTGTAVITAQAGDKKATCVVTVSEKEEVKYPLCYEVEVNLGIRTITTFSSEKDPAPKEESLVQISGTLIGTAVVGRIEKIINDKDYWAGLAQHGEVPVFMASSHYKLRDENDYSKIIFESRGPLQVSVKRTEMDYVLFKEGTSYVDKYIKVYDFLSEGKNEMQSISLDIVPYFPTRLNPLPPISPQYVVGLDILTYLEYTGKKIVGNGHSLKWNYNTEKLEPTGNELYMGIGGSKTETDPGEGVESPLIDRDKLNTYFMNASGGSLSLSMNGSEYKENSGTITQKKIMLTLKFRSIPSVLALPIATPPPPPLEDWDWE